MKNFWRLKAGSKMDEFPKQTGISCKASATLNDRIMKQTIIALILTAVLAACSQSAGSKYNLVMICIDTVRADNFWLLAADQPDDELSVQLNSALRYLSAPFHLSLDHSYHCQRLYRALPTAARCGLFFRGSGQSRRPDTQPTGPVDDYPC